MSPQLSRPGEGDLLIGDPGKAKRELRWEPKTSVEELVKMMVKSDLEGLEAPRLNGNRSFLESMV